MLRILTLSDFSANARNALAVAMRLAQRYGAEVIFVHSMVKTPIPATAPQSLFLELQEAEQVKCLSKLREEVQQLFQALQIRHKEVRYQVQVVSPPFVEQIVRLTEQYNIDLVIMGSTGSSELKRVLMGSNTLQMIKRTFTPLLIIPHEYVFKGFFNITLVIRPKYYKYNGNISILLRIARSYGAKLYFVFVQDDKSEEPNPESFLTKHSHWQEVTEHFHNFYSIRNSDIIKVLQEHMKQINTDLLVTFPSSRNIWEKLVLGSITEEMASQMKTPLLVFPKLEPPRDKENVKIVL